MEKSIWIDTLISKMVTSNCQGLYYTAITIYTQECVASCEFHIMRLDKIWYCANNLCIKIIWFWIRCFINTNILHTVSNPRVIKWRPIPFKDPYIHSTWPRTYPYDNEPLTFCKMTFVKDFHTYDLLPTMYFRGT